MYKSLQALLMCTMFTLSSASAAFTQSLPSNIATQDVNPLWSLIDYFFLNPMKGSIKVVKSSADDMVEDGVKILTIYLTYTKSPISSMKRRYQAALFPVIYLLANKIGDVLGDAVESRQAQNRKEHHTLVASLANDIGEDVTKAGCFIMKFGKGFAPSTAFAKTMERMSAPRFSVIAVNYYALFSAITKCFEDYRFCEENGNIYGNWLESRLTQ